MALITCSYDHDHDHSSIKAKKSIAASMFIIFLFYTIIVIISELKRGSAVRNIKIILMKFIQYS
jgi:hypothetical protein